MIRALLLVAVLSGCATNHETAIYPPFSDRAVIIGSIIAFGAMGYFGN